MPFIKDLASCQPFIAGDRTLLRELLHPDKESLEIRYSLAHAVVKPGQTSLPHRLRSSEVYYILEGKGVTTVDDRSTLVKAGQAIYIPPCAVQCIHNPRTEDLVFLCIVDPAWRQDDEEVIPQGR